MVYQLNMSLVKKSFDSVAKNENRHFKLSFCGTVSRTIEPKCILVSKTNGTDRRGLVLKPINVSTDMHKRRTK